MRVKVRDISAGDNVRLQGDDVKVLAESMSFVGQIVPITVRENADGGYTVIAGHRRLQAAESLGWEEIEVWVQNGDAPENTVAIQAAENIARLDLTPYEIAQAMLDLQAAGMRQEEIAKAVGMGKKEVSLYTRIAKGTRGLDPNQMNLLDLGTLENYSQVHDMPAEMRERFIAEHEQGDFDYWRVNDYVEDIQRYRWSQKKENKVLFEMFANIGAVELAKEDLYDARYLSDDEVALHRGEPDHGFRVRKAWSSMGASGWEYVIDEYCLEPESHAESAKPELAEMAAEATVTRQERSPASLSEAARQKARRDRKKARKEAVLNFSGHPRMRNLTEMMYLCILDEQKPYKWQELGKTFGMEKAEGEYHYNWDTYLDDFSGKDKLTQQLILAIGAWYVTLEGTYFGNTELIDKMDELFGAEIEAEEEPPDEEE